MDTYSKFHVSNLKKSEPVDIETFEKIAENDLHNKLKAISISNFPFETKYFTLDFAKNWFIDMNKKTNPYTNTNTYIEKSFLPRLRIHLEARELFENNLDYNPTTEYLADIFSRYIQNKNSINIKELCEMKLFLHMNDTGFLSDWIVDDKKELRTKANELIENSEPGSWLIRTCSIKDSDCFKARVISYKNLLGQTGIFPIGYLYSYGYFTPLKI